MQDAQILAAHGHTNIPAHEDVNIAGNKTSAIVAQISLSRKPWIMIILVHKLGESRPIIPHDVDALCGLAGPRNELLASGIAMEESCASGELSSFPLS
jgi:hypothetical protein